ncbi:putative bifunctional diguanylate cyclase/phosphodiesterase [Halovibrio sp. HP20-50]|uniref:putative bifunctional diguanylate cyclase/phosphodiesterase n=1 Tax=Halovibrio sp. HP20-59 TaxID=3080275 RepID=UPI00294B619D|nr:EAL domain-containing protein [Halovibrio sp. HP20-59]MEA2117532.1 EAL domain-containing protein [Halovibrio sp. HP20-59]
MGDKKTNSLDPKTLSPKALRDAAYHRMNQGLTDVSDWTGRDIQSLVSELELHQEELRIQNEELQQARNRLEIARENAQNCYRDLFERAPMGYLLLDAQGRIEEANQAASQLLAPGTHLTGLPLSALVASESQDALHLHRRALMSATTTQAVDLTLARDEEATWTVRMESVMEPSTDSGNARFRCALVDITERRQTEDKLRVAARVFEEIGEAIVVMDAAGRIKSINKAFTAITGYTESDALGVIMSGLVKSERQGQVFHKKMWESLNNRGFWQGEIWDRRKSGEIYPEWLTINRIDDDEGEPRNLVAVFSDISQIKNSQRKIEYLASHDALTGLPNRRLFQERAREAIAQALHRGGQAGLLFLDLDNFKDINDTLGHEVGDELLIRVASHLREWVRDEDTVARFGGDEFTVIFTDCDAEKAGFIAQRLVASLAGTFEVRGRHLRVTTSAGLALCPQDGKDVVSLCQAADMAVYRAKQDGRNRLRLYDTALHQRLLEDSAIEQALRRALANGGLRLVYQPQFAANDPTRLVGVEALLRWQDPEMGAISPGRFIPVAERSDLITELGWRVQALVCIDLQQWLAAGLEPPVISFNVSPKAFRDGQFSSHLEEVMRQYGISPGHLQVEFTESTLAGHSDLVLDEIGKLHTSGIELSIDDFGTGYSCLINLKRVPLTELKIDKSFVDGLGENEHDEAIARATLYMAEAFGLRTVAEGVETQQQLEWLQAHGCDRIQGFLLARPLEAEDFQSMLHRTKRTS